jgi:hypothetical protein
MFCCRKCSKVLILVGMFSCWSFFFIFFSFLFLFLFFFFFFFPDQILSKNTDVDSADLIAGAFAITIRTGRTRMATYFFDLTPSVVL